jgi:hypothetical protein
MTSVGYDPDRVALLLGRVGDAARALALIRCDDPAAAAAAAALRRARSNLEQRWTPVLRRIAGLTALTSWTLRLDLEAELALRALVERVGGPTGTELRPLLDAALLRELDGARRLVLEDGDSADPAAWVRFASLLAELARRVSSPAGASLLAALDGGAARELARATALGSELSRGGHLVGVGGDEFQGAALAALAAVLGAVARIRPRGVADVAALASDPATGSIVAQAILRSPGAVPTSVVVAIVVAEVGGLDERALQPGRAVERLVGLEGLLDVLVSRPGELAALLGTHPDVARVLATTSLLDATLVTRTIAAGLGAAHPTADADRARALANLVAVGAHTALTRPALVGIAAASPAWMSFFADRDVNPSPDRDVVVEAGGGGVRLGSHADVSAFVGQLVERRELAPLLQTGMLAVVERQVDDAITGVLPLGGGPARDAMLAHVSGVANVMGVLADAKHEREEQVNADRAAAGDVVGVGFDLLDLATSGLPAVGRLATGLAERVVDRAVAHPIRLPHLDVLSRTSEEVVVTLLAAPLAEPALREPLGLDVDEATWARVATAIDEYRAAEPTGVDDAWRELKDAYTANPALHGYVSAILDRLDVDDR